jgi:hypothetical protein
MKTQYKYINFVKIADKPKTSVFACINNRSGEPLGTVQWYAPWRQYCFFPANECVFNVGCMDDIKDFIGQLKKEVKYGN